jgi:hypothetical protein
MEMITSAETLRDARVSSVSSSNRGGSGSACERPGGERHLLCRNSLP